MSEPTDAAVFDHSYKPPVTVAVVEKDHRVPLGGIGLALDGRNECVEGVDELEIDILWYL